MSTKKLAYFLALALVFSFASPALAAKAPSAAGRYLIKSKVGIWKSGLSIRHMFDGGFTADLSDWQLRVAKLFGVTVEPVQKLSILVTDIVAVEEPASVSFDDTARTEPNTQVAWGVRIISGTVRPTGGNGVLVAVLDTGADVTHPDIAQRIAICKDFTAKPPFVDEGCNDENGHGTHVAGIIAADSGQDGLGIFGVAPAANLAIYKACDDTGLCYADDVAVAIRTAVDDGAQIVVVSAGADVAGPLMEEAVAYANEAGVLVVAAAGNDGPYAGSIDYPAAHQSVISVGAADSDLAVPDWSSRGANSRTELRAKDKGDLEFAAPGVNIESTWNDGGYAILSGTSMAAAHVAGLAASLWDTKTKDPVASVRSALYEITTDLLPPGEDDDSGYGMPQRE